MPAGSCTLMTGKSWLKLAVVLPRTNAATPSTEFEPYGLSAPDSALESWKSSAKPRRSEASHARLKPNDLFSFLLANLAPPIDRSLFAAGIDSVYTSGPATGPSVQLLLEGPKLNHTDNSLRSVAILFSE